MHSSTVALDSLPPRPILLTFLDLLLFPLVLKFSVSYALLIFPLSETLKLPFCLLPNWSEKRRALPAMYQREKGDQLVFAYWSARRNQTTT